MVLVENLTRLVDVDRGAGALGPGQDGQPFDVVAGEGVVGRHGRHARKPGELLQSLLLHVFGHARVVDLLAQIFDFALAFVLLAQFLLDGLHLLAEIVIALRLLNLILHFVLDLGAQLLHLDFLGEVSIQELEAGGNSRSFKQLLLVFGGQERQGRGDKIDQPAGVFDVGGDGAQFIRQRGGFGHDLLELADHHADEGLHIGGGLDLFGVHGLDLGNHEGLGLNITDKPYALHAFSEDKAALVGHTDDFVNRGQGADFVHVFRSRRVLAGIFLRRHDDGAVLAQRLNQLDGTLPADGEGQNGVRKENGIADGKNRHPLHGRFGIRGSKNLWWYWWLARH